MRPSKRSRLSREPREVIDSRRQRAIVECGWINYSTRVEGVVEIGTSHDFESVEVEVSVRCLS